MLFTEVLSAKMARKYQIKCAHPAENGDGD